MSVKKLPEGLVEGDDSVHDTAYIITTGSKAKKSIDGIPESPAAEELTSGSQQVPVHSVRFREASAQEKRRQRLIFAFWSFCLLLALVLSGGFIILDRSPAARKWAQKRLKKLESYAAQHQGNMPLFSLNSIERKLMSWYGPGSQQAAIRPWKEMDCRFLIQEALSRKLNNGLDAEGRYLLVSCQLSQDMPLVALRTATESFSDKASLKQSLKGWEGVRDQLITAEARFRTQAFDVRALSRFDGCKQWVIKPDCLLRFVDEARQPLRSKGDKAFQVFEKGLGPIPANLKVWFYWAGAQNAIKEGRTADAENRLQAAGKFLRETYDPFLERAVFKSRVQNAWLQKDRGLMQQVWKERPKEWMRDDALAFLDVELMHKSLIDPVHGLDQLDGFLNQPESYLRYRYDPLFVQWVVEQALRNRRTGAGREYLERLTNANREGEAKDLYPIEWLEILWVRIALAEGKGIEALKALQKMERYVQNSSLLYHLKGLAFLEGFTSREYRLRAAQEFQKAVNNEGTPESYLAIILSFLEAGAVKKAEATLTYWQKQKLSEASKPWVGLARGLVLHRSGKPSAASKEWTDLKFSYPDFEIMRKIEQNLKGDPKYLDSQLLENFQLMLGPYGALGPLVFLGQKS